MIRRAPCHVPKSLPENVSNSTSSPSSPPATIRPVSPEKFSPTSLAGPWSSTCIGVPPSPGCRCRRRRDRRRADRQRGRDVRRRRSPDAAWTPYRHRSRRRNRTRSALRDRRQRAGRSAAHRARDDRRSDRAVRRGRQRADVDASPGDLGSDRSTTIPNVVKVVVDRDGDALYFSRSKIPYCREDGVCFKHIGLYGFRREFLLTFAALAQTPLERAESLEQLRALEHGYRIRAVETRFESIEVDTPEDLERVRRRVSAAARV